MKTKWERERKAKKGLSKANTEEAFNNPQRAVNVSLATVVSSDDGVDTLATALAALHTFYELEEAPLLCLQPTSKVIRS